MYCNLHRALTLAITFLFTSTAFAQNHEICANILENQERLNCFDQLHASSKSLIDTRRELELENADNAFAITAHRPIYILPFSHNKSSDYSQYGRFDDPFKKTEVKFQISLKYPIVRDLLWDSSIQVAYTQQSYWQLYAEKSASAPFRETNYEPEMIWAIPTDISIGKLSMKNMSFSLNHQSNGRAEPLSRSWNRIVNQYVFEIDHLAVALTWWWRLEERKEDDNNPNIENYMGRLSLNAFYKIENHSFDLGLKNNAHKNNRSGIQFDWMFPLSSKLRGYVQLYSGYGENLIDQENYTNRISVGLALSDWL